MVNELLGTEASINPYQVRNSKALAAAKGLVCYKNGITKQRMSIKRLRADALEKRDHSLALSGNMQLARGEMQIQGTDAHHIVSRTHQLARFSREYLFAWRIGIDDADNGVFLPEQFGANTRDWKTRMRIPPSTPSSTILKLQAACFFAVESRLQPDARNSGPCVKR